MVPVLLFTNKSALIFHQWFKFSCFTNSVSHLDSPMVSVLISPVVSVLLFHQWCQYCYFTNGVCPFISPIVFVLLRQCYLPSRTGIRMLDNKCACSSIFPSLVNIVPALTFFNGPSCYHHPTETFSLHCPQAIVIAHLFISQHDI